MLGFARSIIENVTHAYPLLLKYFSMFNSDVDRVSLRQKRTLTLLLIGAMPLIVATVLATYYANQKRPTTILAAELNNLAPIGEIIVGNPIEQSFLCPVDDFESFRLMAATYARTNSAKYKVTLSGGLHYGKDEFLVDAREVKDNAWIDFKLKNVWKRCKGRTLRLNVDAIDAVPGNALTFYTTSPYYRAKIAAPKKLELESRQLALEVNTQLAATEKPMPQLVEDSTPKNQITQFQPPASSTELKTSYDNIGNFGEVVAGKAIHQAVVCPVEKLKSIRVLAATFVRVNTAQYQLSVAEGMGEAQVLTVASSRAKDNDWISFTLPKPIDSCIGKVLSLKIQSKDAKLGNALTFYHKPKYYSGTLVEPVDPALDGRQLLIEMNQ